MHSRILVFYLLESIFQGYGNMLDVDTRNESCLFFVTPV